MEFGGRKRGRQEGGFNGAQKRPRDESENNNFTPGVGSKSKPCTKFFRIWKGYVLNESIGLGVFPRRVSRINTPEGCKFGDKCRFAHSEVELGSKSSFPAYEDPRAQPGPFNYGGGGGYQGRMEPGPPGLTAAANFGQSATAKISIDGALAGPIIGKGGVNSKQICRLTGVKFAIRDHDTDPSQKNIELEGSFDQIKQASEMVHELIMNLRSGGGGGGANGPPQRKFGGFQQQQGGQGLGHGGANKIKTKMCENFAKGQCTFGDRCHFAHGPEELRK
ncbi:K Homology domain-containing protein [Artemisia annua]|uniref:K Homology domain-containing protein n=1 Tax=Artemisia annua TaxID=35608 RepID=A0A2U1L254_ARTAN|nr:K Homology domain-containing protein [Artemisia annua]